MTTSTSLITSLSTGTSFTTSLSTGTSFTTSTTTCFSTGTSFTTTFSTTLSTGTSFTTTFSITVGSAPPQATVSNASRPAMIMNGPRTPTLIEGTIIHPPSSYQDSLVLELSLPS